MKYGYLSFYCASCKLGKNNFLPFPLQGNRISTCFDIIYFNIQGINHVFSHAQYKYFATFIDDYSLFVRVFFLHSKDDVLLTFKTFVTYVETQFFTHFKIVCSDSRGEYMSHPFQSFLQQKGILSQYSCPFTPQQMTFSSLRIDIF